MTTPSHDTVQCCAACGSANAVLRCSACTVYPCLYCNETCQSNHWDTHKLSCQQNVPDSLMYRYDDEGIGRTTAQTERVHTAPSSLGDLSIGVENDGDKEPASFIDLGASSSVAQAFERERATLTYRDDRTKARAAATATIFDELTKDGGSLLPDTYLDNVEALIGDGGDEDSPLIELRALEREMRAAARQLVEGGGGGELQLRGDAREQVRLVLDKLDTINKAKREFARAPNARLADQIRRLERSQCVQLAALGQKLRVDDGNERRVLELATEGDNARPYDENPEKYKRDADVAALGYYCGAMKAKYVGAADFVRSASDSANELLAALGGQTPPTDSEAAAIERAVRQFLSSYAEETRTRLADDPLRRQDSMIADLVAELLPPLPVGANGTDDDDEKGKARRTRVSIAQEVADVVEEMIRDSPTQTSRTIVQQIVDFLDVPNVDDLSTIDPVLQSFLAGVEKVVENVEFVEEQAIPRPTRSELENASQTFLHSAIIFNADRELVDEIRYAIEARHTRWLKYTKAVATAIALVAVAYSKGSDVYDSYFRSATSSRAAVPSPESTLAAQQQLSLGRVTSLATLELAEIDAVTFNSRTPLAEYIGDTSRIQGVQDVSNTLVRKSLEVHDEIARSGESLDEVIRRRREVLADEGGAADIYDQWGSIMSDASARLFKHWHFWRRVRELGEAGASFRTSRNVVAALRRVVDLGARSSASVLSEEDIGQLRELRGAVERAEVDTDVAQLIFDEAVARVESYVGTLRGLQPNAVLQRLESETSDVPLSARFGAVHRLASAAGEQVDTIEALEKAVANVRINLGRFLDTRSNDEVRANALGNLRSAIDDEVAAIERLRSTAVAEALDFDDANETLRRVPGFLQSFARSRDVNRNLLEVLLQNALIDNVTGDDTTSTTADTNGLSELLAEEEVVSSVQKLVEQVQRILTTLKPGDGAVSVERGGDAAALLEAEASRIVAADVAMMRDANGLRVREVSTRPVALEQAFRRQLLVTDGQYAQARDIINGTYSQLTTSYLNFYAKAINSDVRFDGTELSDLIDPLDTVVRDMETWSFDTFASATSRGLFGQEFRVVDDFHVSRQISLLRETDRRLRAEVESNADELRRLAEQTNRDDEQQRRFEQLEQASETASRFTALLATIKEVFETIALVSGSIPSYLLLFTVLLPNKVTNRVSTLWFYIRHRDLLRKMMTRLRRAFDNLDAEFARAESRFANVAASVRSRHQDFVAFRRNVDSHERYFQQLESTWLGVIARGFQGATIAAGDFLALQQVSGWVYRSQVALPISAALFSPFLRDEASVVLAMDLDRTLVSTAVASTAVWTLPTLLSRGIRRLSGTERQFRGRSALLDVATVVENHFPAAAVAASVAWSHQLPDVLSTFTSFSNPVAWTFTWLALFYSALWINSSAAGLRLFRASNRVLQRETTNTRRRRTAQQ